MTESRPNRVRTGSDVALRALAQNVLVVKALVKMVRDEYPADLSLSEIVRTWGGGAGVTPDEVAAIEAWEARQ